MMAEKKDHPSSVAFIFSVYSETLEYPKFDYPNDFASSQLVWIIEVALYMIKVILIHTVLPEIFVEQNFRG